MLLIGSLKCVICEKFVDLYLLCTMKNKEYYVTCMEIKGKEHLLNDICFFSKFIQSDFLHISQKLD